MTNSAPDYATERETAEEVRRLARKRIQAKRDLGTHAVVYLVVNSFLIFIWFVSGQDYFWPVWVLAGWGIGLVLNVWEVYGRKPITEADVDEELRRSR